MFTKQMARTKKGKRKKGEEEQGRKKSISFGVAQRVFGCEKRGVNTLLTEQNMASHPSDSSVSVSMARHFCEVREAYEAK